MRTRKAVGVKVYDASWTPCVIVKAEEKYMTVRYKDGRTRRWYRNAVSCDGKYKAG